MRCGELRHVGLRKKLIDIACRPLLSAVENRHAIANVLDIGEDIAQAMAELEQLDSVLNARMGEAAPGLMGLREAVESGVLPDASEDTEPA